MTDLEESITLSREALRLVPLDHPDRSELLNDLANALHRQYCHLGDVENLDESMDFHREALTLCPPSHPSRRKTLINLTNCLFSFFEQDEEMLDLQSCIEYCLQAVSLNTERISDKVLSLDHLGYSL